MQAYKTNGYNRLSTATPSQGISPITPFNTVNGQALSNRTPSFKTEDPLDSVIAGIARDLGCTLENIPSTFDTQTAAKILNLSPHTLCAWRSKGLYTLDYLKMGRRVRYPLTSLAQFILSRLRKNTQQGLSTRVIKKKFDPTGENS